MTELYEASAALNVPQVGVNSETSDLAWRGLYKIGGAAALVAGVIFRRNIGAEVSLFSAQQMPETTGEWFGLLQNNRFLGLTYLNLFDLVDFALLGLMFLALYAALRRVNPSAMVIAMTLGITGVGVSFASNTVFSMASLSDQYAAATSEAQRSMTLAAGQAVLALNGLGMGNYMSFLLLAAAGLIISLVMLQSNLFSRATAYIGILAGVLDLTDCITFAILPGLEVYLLSGAGLLLCIWHILIGLRLYRKEEK